MIQTLTATERGRKAGVCLRINAITMMTLSPDCEISTITVKSDCTTVEITNKRCYDFKERPFNINT